MWVWAGIVGVLVAAWSVWRWTTLPEAGIAVMGFAAFLLTVVGTVDDHLKNLMREVQELRRERQSIQPKTDN